MNRLRGSNDLVIVIHEIYGINQHIQEVCESLSGEGFDIICPNLLNRQAFDYFEEEAAYRNFMENVGFANASAEVRKILLDVKDRYEKIYIVGFSVGATAGWLCSEEDGLDGVVGYYGSRIRNYLKVAPACPVMLSFAEIMTKKKTKKSCPGKETILNDFDNKLQFIIYTFPHQMLQHLRCGFLFLFIIINCL